MQDRLSFYCSPLGVVRALARPSRYAGSPEPLLLTFGSLRALARPSRYAGSPELLLLTFVSCEGSDETE